MSAELSASELAEVAETYRVWREWDLSHAPSAQAKKELQGIESAARELEAAMRACGPRSRDAILRRVPYELDKHGAVLDRATGILMDPQVAQSEIASLTAALADSAVQAQAEFPRAWPNTAARMAAHRLRVLFAHHGMRFTAFASETGSVSDAVAAFMDAADHAGEPMKQDAARKWIEFAIHEAEEKDRETIEQN